MSVRAELWTQAGGSIAIPPWTHPSSLISEAKQDRAWLALEPRQEDSRNLLRATPSWQSLVRSLQSWTVPNRKPWESKMAQEQPGWVNKTLGCSNHLQQPQQFLRPTPPPILVTCNWEAFTCSWTSPSQGRQWEFEWAVLSETQHSSPQGALGNLLAPAFCPWPIDSL